jgi:hypothetical protein
MNKENTQDFYLTLIDIRAGDDDICRPQLTKEPLVRIVTANDNRESLQSTKPHSPRL